jgi:uncharacterized membrane protein
LKLAESIPRSRGNGAKKLESRLPRSVKVSMTAIMSATALSLSYARFWAPNIEFTSLIIFLSGVTLGSRIGVLVGLVTESIFSTFNPLGPAPIPVFLAQIVCMMLIGATGGLFARFTGMGETRLNSSLRMAAIGLYLTIVFDLVTNLGWAFSFGLDYPTTLLINGSVFMILHVVSNTIIFGTVGPVLSHYMLRIIRKEGVYI